MPIIRDGQTPEGRVVKCRPSVDSTTPCRVRKMTEEERAYYGEPVPPSEWGTPPCVCRNDRRCAAEKGDGVQR